MFIVLAHWNNSPRVNMSLHSDTLFWFRAIQSLFFLVNALCLAEKQQIPIVLSLVWPDRGSNPRSTALEHANHYATDVVINQVGTFIQSPWLIQFSNSSANLTISNPSKTSNYNMETVKNESILTSVFFFSLFFFLVKSFQKKKML